MSILGVSESAERLGLSERRVRQLLSDGALAGERVGRVWVIRRDRLDRFARQRSGAGRPWSPKSAWAVLLLAEGRAVGLSPVDRSRAAKRLAEGLERVVGKLASRCERRCFNAHPGVMGRLSAGIVAGGVSAASRHGAGLVAGEAVEGYVRAGEIRPLVARFGLDGQAERPNLLLRVVADDVWPFDPGQAHAGRLVVAVDLIENDDERAQRAGAWLLSRP